MNDERTYIRVHGSDHRFIESIVDDSEMNYTIAEYIEILKEREG
jgi:hypothetical protein